MSSSVHVDNKKKDILNLVERSTQQLDVTADKKYSINFTQNNKRFCLSLHYNRANSYLFVNGTVIIFKLNIIIIIIIIKYKARDYEIAAALLCLENISKGFSVDNIKTTGLNEYIYYFSADYHAIVVDNILDIHK